MSWLVLFGVFFGLWGLVGLFYVGEGLGQALGWEPRVVMNQAWIPAEEGV